MMWVKEQLKGASFVIMALYNVSLAAKGMKDKKAEQFIARDVN